MLHGRCTGRWTWSAGPVPQLCCKVTTSRPSGFCMRATPRPHQSTKWEAGLLELQHHTPCSYLDLMPDLSSSLPPSLPPRSRNVVLLDRYHNYNYISMTSGQAPITVSGSFLPPPAGDICRILYYLSSAVSLTSLVEGCLHANSKRVLINTRDVTPK